MLSRHDSRAAPQTVQTASPVCGTKNFSSLRLYSAPQLHGTIVAIPGICASDRRFSSPELCHNRTDPLPTRQRFQHLRDRHQHTSVYLFHPFSCPVLTLVQLSDGERFLYSRRLQRDAQAAHNSLSGSAINDSNRRSTAGASCVTKSVIKITAPRSESQDCREK